MLNECLQLDMYGKQESLSRDLHKIKKKLLFYDIIMYIYNYIYTIYKCVLILLLSQNCSVTKTIHICDNENI